MAALLSVYSISTLELPLFKAESGQAVNVLEAVIRYVQDAKESINEILQESFKIINPNLTFGDISFELLTNEKIAALPHDVSEEELKENMIGSYRHDEIALSNQRRKEGEHLKEVGLFNQSQSQLTQSVPLTTGASLSQ